MERKCKNMQYEYHNFNPERYATALRYDSKVKRLVWDCAGGQDVLIIQTPYGVNPVDEIQKICEKLTTIQLDRSEFRMIYEGVWGRIVTAADRVLQQGCPLNGEASTYTVFSYEIEDDHFKIFAPQNQAMITSSCDIPIEIQITVKCTTRQEGFIHKRQVPTGFYSIVFPTHISRNYMDGDIYYMVQNMQIPITKKMLENQTIYIKTNEKPVVKSRNRGLRLI